MVEDRGRVRVDGAELYYEVGGEGRSLVLLHDGLLDRRVWDDQFVDFARLYRTVRYDRRGTVSRPRPTGRSPTFRTSIACYATSWASSK